MQELDCENRYPSDGGKIPMCVFSSTELHPPRQSYHSRARLNKRAIIQSRIAAD
jgi:hypothetical protein